MALCEPSEPLRVKKSCTENHEEDTEKHEEKVKKKMFMDFGEMLNLDLL